MEVSPPTTVGREVLKKKSDILITNYETGEEYYYDPPLEIKLLLQKNATFRKIAFALGESPVLQKFYGNIFGKESFAKNHPREHHSDGITTPVLSSDGYLTRSGISKEGLSSVLEDIKIDIKEMVGLAPSPEKIERKKRKLFNAQFQKDTQAEMKKKFPAFEGGQHDLAILKPEHKHICTVPLRSTVKRIYRVGSDNSIFPDKIPNNKLNEKTPSTDPLFALQNAKQLKIFDGNQRMVFVMEAIIDDKPMEYLMVAHAAAFVSGIESLVGVGDEISPGKDMLFKFHQGSSLSTLWPKNFSEKFKTRPDVDALTTKNRVLEVLEGQVIYEEV